MEDDKQQKSADNQHQQQKHPEEQEHKQQQQQQQQQQQGQHHQEQQNHHEEEKQQQKEEQEKQEEEAENKQNQTVSQFPLSKRSTPPRTIPKAQLPPSDPSPVDSPLSSDRSSLSHGFSPPPTTASQPSDPNSKPPALAVFTADFTSTDQSTAATVEVEEQKQKLGSGSGKKLRPDLSILRKTKRDKMVRKALLGFRISGFAFCLVSFSVLAADKDQGWSLDSFYRYKEFRFCMAVNVIGFVYSAIQAYDLAYQLASGKQKPRSRLRCFLDFVLDQDLAWNFFSSTANLVRLRHNTNFSDREMLAYVLVSASSSAAVRVDDWEANWGKDKFPEMARVSMALSLVAFIALAFSSLISGYYLSTFKSM